MSNMHSNRVICPYCGYRLPLSYSKFSNCREISVICKGRNCKKAFNIIVEKGVQKNLVPDSEIINSFRVVFGADYKKHIKEKFGVDVE